MELTRDMNILRTQCLPVSKPRGLAIGRDLIWFAGRWNVENPGRKCLGLAAPQVGINKRVFVVNIAGYFRIFVNPSILEQSEEQIEWTEQCISLPGKEVKTFRSGWVKVTADNNKVIMSLGLAPENMESSRSANEMLLEAIAFQHEFDHLNGILMTDRDASFTQRNIKPVVKENEIGLWMPRPTIMFPTPPRIY